MSGAWTIYRRELAGLFFGPLAWVLLCIALLLNGWMFTLYLRSNWGDVDSAFAWTLGDALPYWLMMIVLPPLLTMKMVSEESRTGLLEFLLTSPVTDLAVVLGKLFAATTFMALLWSSVLVYGLTTQALGTAPDWAPLLGAFIATTLTAALFSAIGLTASAGTNTPLLAAFLAVVLNVTLLLLPNLAELGGASPDNWLGAFRRRVDILARLQGSSTRGVIDTAHVCFFVAWTAFFVFVATRLLESRRWR